MPENKIGLNDVAHQQMDREEGTVKLEGFCTTFMAEPCAELQTRYLEVSGPGRVYDPRYIVELALEVTHGPVCLGVTFV